MDPNKYAKNAKINPNSPIHTLKSLAVFGLVIVGLIGLARDLFKEDGWIKSAFTSLLDSSIGLLMIPIIIALIWVFNRWTASPNKDQRSKAGDVPLYLMMAVGAFYLLKWLTTGNM